MINYDLAEHIQITTTDFSIAPRLWESFDRQRFGMVNDPLVWKEIKYINEQGGLNEEIELIDSNKGGIYIFSVDPNIVPNLHSYLMYIGKSEITQHQNIKKRIKEYYDYVANPDKDERPRVRLFFHYWKDYIHVRYMLLDDNELIKELEEALINSIHPPINTFIPKKENRNAIAAFGG